MKAACAIPRRLNFMGRKAQMRNIEDNSIQRKGAILARYPGQRILIGESTVIKIVKIEGTRVYIHIETKVDVTIARPSKEEDQLDKALGARSQTTSSAKRNLKD